MRNLRLRHFARRNDGSLKFFEQVHHLPQARDLRIDDVVSEHHGKRFVADGIARDEDSVAQTQCFLLTHVGKIDHVRNLPHFVQLVLLTS